MNDLAWRKFPVNTIRNEDLDYIAFLMPQELQTAPFMFYMTAICKCDDDGVFDIEDGVIFARLMRIPNRPEVVYEIAKYMTQRRILTQVIPGSSIFMITDWDAPDRRGVVKTKSAEERRTIIAQKIEAERKQRLQSPAPSAHPASSIQINPHSTIPQAAMPAELWQPTEPALIVPSPEASAMPSPVVNFEEVRAQTASESAFFALISTKTRKMSKRQRERETEREIQKRLKRVKERHTQKRQKI